ncbi:uncharacterized protein LOC104890052 isoform X2 [Beta vulgaris subsp. vulgaris]|uniref:uncharacterized protein LOC104890052 isoform X2 n=1 Tax=Beta vulgaris subsp. vulgaris TaxID=3555 RepID=UPI002036CC36|nr:uncharacterized protein LOC104890052 isoform X2 [Beta vulgaris subsp. vulgaris]
MEALYIKLYEKYSKLKVAKDNELDQVNQEQEVKFMEFMSENKRLSDDIDELRKEVVSSRTAKDQQYDDFQQRLMEEKQKNRELSAEVEQLRQLQQEKPHSSNRTDHNEEQIVNSTRSPSVSRGKFTESPMRMTRKRARLAAETDSARNNVSVGLLELSTGRGISSDQPKIDVPIANAQPECCQSNLDNEGPCKCLFQNFVECLTGMKVTMVNQPEGRCIHVVHQSSGYSFDLTWVNKPSPGGELLYNVSSLGTFVNVAPVWMREVIIFSVSMCPIFFERVSRVIKHY